MQRQLAKLGDAGKTPPQINVIMLHDAERALLAQGITPVWLLPKHGNRSLWTRTSASLYESCWDDDAKHGHPLNHLRFYLTELPQLKHLDRLLMFDDDTCVRRDLQPFYTPKILRSDSPATRALSPVLYASCDIPSSFWRHNNTRTPAWIAIPPGMQVDVKIRHGKWRYADTPMHPDGFLQCNQTPPQTGCAPSGHNGCSPPSLAKSLLTAHQRISRSVGDYASSVRDPAQELAWNYGFVLIDMREWRAMGMTERFDKWFQANHAQRWFAPWTLGFGLGLPFLALAGRVSCWPVDTVIDGLGFLEWSTLRENGINETRMGHATVFHWAGGKKASSAVQDECSVESVASELKLRDADGSMTAPSCQDWCHSHPDQWSKKCEWAGNHCATCDECTSMIAPSCQDWCHSHPDQWSKKCEWAGNHCATCDECTLGQNRSRGLPECKVNHFAQPVCQEWCASHKDSWSEKCEWAGCDCFTCDDCVLLRKRMHGMHNKRLKNEPKLPSQVVSLLSDRDDRIAAVMYSVISSENVGLDLHWDLITTNKTAIAHKLSLASWVYGTSAAHAHISSLEEAESDLLARDITPVWLWPEFEHLSGKSRRLSPWSLPKHVGGNDTKHKHPLNLMRIYLAELSWLASVESLLLLDDDVCVARDLTTILRNGHEMMQASRSASLKAPTVVASCQMQVFEPSTGTFNIQQAYYKYHQTPFLGLSHEPCAADTESASPHTCVPNGFHDKLAALQRQITGRPSLGSETAWNFGFALVNLRQWREAGMMLRFKRWFEANQQLSLFASTSIPFGLGIPTLLSLERLHAGQAGRCLTG